MIADFSMVDFISSAGLRVLLGTVKETRRIGGDLRLANLVRETVYASGAMFPILPPICLKDKWLIDGAYSSPLPIIEAVNERMDVIIAIIIEEMSTERNPAIVNVKTKKRMKEVGKIFEKMTGNIQLK